MMGETSKAVIDELSSKKFLSWLENLTGISGLISDPDLDGGGLHMIEKGGFLMCMLFSLTHHQTELESTVKFASLLE